MLFQVEVYESWCQLEWIDTACLAKLVAPKQHPYLPKLRTSRLKYKYTLAAAYSTAHTGLSKLLPKTFLVTSQ